MQSLADGLCSAVPPALQDFRCLNRASATTSIQTFTTLQSTTNAVLCKRGMQGCRASPAVGKCCSNGACKASFEFCMAARCHPARSPVGALRRGGTALDAICISGVYRRCHEADILASCVSQRIYFVGVSLPPFQSGRLDFD